MKVIKPEMDEIQKKYKEKRDMADPLAMAAALPLYWTIGGLFMVMQTLVIKNVLHELQ